MDNRPAEDFYEMVSGHCKEYFTSRLTACSRLNNKLKVRDVAVDDLAHDLSDGVCPVDLPIGLSSFLAPLKTEP